MRGSHEPRISYSKETFKNNFGKAFWRVKIKHFDTLEWLSVAELFLFFGQKKKLFLYLFIFI